MTDISILKFSFALLFPIFLGSTLHTPSFAQRVGDQAELDRLEKQADDLAGQHDPEGAALAIGKAAMMADRLMNQSKEPAHKHVWQAGSDLYRGQELGLRALALFERAGGQPPAPAGVCHYLIQGQEKLQTSKNVLEKEQVMASEEFKIRQENLLDRNEEWGKWVQILFDEFQCMETLTKGQNP